MKVNPINNNQTNFGAKLKLTGEVKRMQIHRSNRLEELKKFAELIGTKKDVITKLAFATEAIYKLHIENKNLL